MFSSSSKRSSQRSSLWLTLASVSLFQLSAISAPTPSYADSITEFDQGTEGWSAAPNLLRSTSNSGWSNVGNDSEQALKANPIGGSAHHNWKLSRTFDLTNLSEPSLEVKLHFKGHNYQRAMILLGDEHALALSDFTVLHEATAATASPETHTFDLTAYEGQKVRVMILLQKPSGLTESKIGLYVHRIALKTPPTPINLNETEGELRLSAFNVQVYGQSKASETAVMDELTQIFTSFDGVFMQEIRDSSGESPQTLLDRLNGATGGLFDVQLSPRLGRTSSKEQYGFYYRVDKLMVLSAVVPEDPSDVFEREPYVLHLEHLDSGQRFWVLGAHLDPDAVPSEIEALYQVWQTYEGLAPADEPWVVWGDFNADCSYLNNGERAVATLLNTPELSSLISDSADTTTSATDCAYDRMFVTPSLSTVIDESGVYDFQQARGLTDTLTSDVSDHFPVWFRFAPATFAP